jgi:chaperonin GroEL (HSP60 family)
MAREVASKTSDLAGDGTTTAKVVRVALQNAASLAAILWTTEAIVADMPEPKKKPAVPTPEDRE